VLSGLFTGAIFAVILSFALRAQRAPVRTGTGMLVGRTGSAKSLIDPHGQVQLDSELWSAELAEGEKRIKKGEPVEVVQVDGLRLKVRKKKTT
jgi:membrane-bound serine protease (ClpP class)